MDIQTYCRELTTELQHILQYWMEHAVDTDHGGFYGSIDNNNTVNEAAPKGLVLNARILWAFSAAFNFTRDDKYLPIATRAHQYLHNHFTDEVYGGMYWSVDASGNMLNDRKQVYGLAFYLYGLSEYYQAVQEPRVLDQAIQLFRLIDEKSFDAEQKGYFEAFARDWSVLPDIRLSDKDANERKTMNTHLHVIEAYANLYKQWPDELLRNRILQLLEVFDKYMIDKDTHHLALFFDEDWNEKPGVVSYGHDIEAAWLLQQSAGIVNDKDWTDKMKEHAIQIANAAMKGLDADGGLWYEYVPAKAQLVKEKHWWPQAEAMVGFFNAWQVSGNDAYLELSFSSWNFTKQYIRNRGYGEWVWGVNADYSVMEGKDKVGMWKCPYHNGRACMEIIRRIQKQP